MEEIYPQGWARLEGFAYLSPLSLIRPLGAVLERRGPDGDYVLQHDFVCAVEVDGLRREIRAPRGLITDLASVPVLFRVFVGRVGPWLEGAILHDWLYVAWQLRPGGRVRPRDRLFADRVFLLAMEAAGVRPWRRWAIYAAVRLFGGRAYRLDRPQIFADLDDPCLHPEGGAGA